MPPSVRPLRAELEAVARRELNEDPARREQDLAHIREWLKKQPHIKARTDDQWLMAFLRGCKFSLERTKEKLDTYYTVRTLLPEFFSKRDPMSPEIQEVLKLGTNLPLKVVDDQGRRIILMRGGRADPRKTKMTTSMKVNFMIMDILLQEDDDLVVNGDCDLVDFKNMGMGHVSQMNPAMAKKIAMCYQEAYPVRPKSLNYIHFPSIMQTLFSLIQSFVKEKIKKRIHIHSDMDSLYKEIPKRLLPKEYGGEGESVDKLIAHWKNKVESYRDWFLEDEKNKTDEKKRKGRPKTQASMFGIEGSFRQLNLD